VLFRSGGPIGAAIGLGGGALIGSVLDINNLGVSGDFLDRVSQDLTPGKVAVVAEVSEDWVTPLDTRMDALGGIVIRERRADVTDELAREKAAARKAELAHLKAEYAQTKAENKAKLKARIDEAQAKARAASDRIQARIDQLQEEIGAKIKAMEEQAGKARGDAKTKIEQRIAELRADDKRRSRELKQAWKLTKEALAP
jgi:hypothetical protein